MPIRQLTAREREVMDLLLKGLSEKEVANRLQMSRHTVHGHVKQLHLKLNVSSRAQLIVVALKAAREAESLSPTASEHS